MKTMTQNEVTDNIFKILEIVKNGEDILVKGNHSKEYFAVIMPYKKYKLKKDRPLGILKGKANFKIKDNFAITEEELLTL